MTSFRDTVQTIEQLRAMYREPTDLVRAKKQLSIDAVAGRFIAASPFVLVGTSSPSGAIEVSPRGGPAGFVQVLDPNRIALPDLNGNNLLDSMVNIVTNPHVGLLFVHPGKDETLRVNGRAWITTDPDVLGGFSAELQIPKAAIGVEVTEIFVHCAKSFRRGSVWNPESWSQLDEVDAIDVISSQLAIDMPRSALLQQFADTYAAELAED